MPLKSAGFFAGRWILVSAIMIAAGLRAAPELLPLWDGTPPHHVGTAGAETIDAAGTVGNVSVPAIAVHLPPPERATGQAFIVCPGGSYSRIGLFTLYLALFPLLWHWRAGRWRRLAMAFYGLAPLLAMLSGRVCDERFGLVAQFVAHMARAPMGGRLLAFPYASCLPHEQLVFGSQPGSTAFTPHNVILDVFNDAGWIPFVLLLLAMLLVLKAWLQGFLQALVVEGCSPGLVLRWGIFSVLLVQWLAQPFLYTDQLMFSLGFVFLGITLAEFGRRSVPVSC